VYDQVGNGGLSATVGLQLGRPTPAASTQISCGRESAPVPGDQVEITPSAPRMTGPAVVGGVLAATDATYAGLAPITTSFTWEQCNAEGDACGPIPGATGASLDIPEAAVGHTVRVRSTAVNSDGEATTISPATALVVARATSPAPPSQGPASPPPGRVGTPPITRKPVAPTVSRLAFVRAGRGNRRAAIVRFTSSRAGRANISVDRLTSGRRIGGACVKELRSNRRRHTCPRYVTQRRAVTAVKMGRNVWTLPGRSLDHGRFRVSVTVTAPDGTRSQPATAALSVKR
jgi:hypothetical protein